MTRANAFYLAVGALAGTLVALAVLPIGFIAGDGGLWPRPRHDLNAYLITWEYFVHDSWRLPPLDVPQLGYPEGGSVLLTDGLPLAQIITKAIYSLTGVAVNPFGWWILLTYMLQGVMAARIAYAVGNRSYIGAAGAAILAVGTTFFVTRIWHVAISSHFLILWALALYVENVRDRVFTPLSHFVLTVVTLAVNAYLFVMVCAIQTLTFASLVARGVIGRRDWQHAAMVVGGTALIGLGAGYSTLFGGPASLRADGFGLFSWNPMSLVVPPATHWGDLGIVRYATGGQAEGESYVGAGNLLVLLACLVLRPREVVRAMGRHWILVVGLLFFAAFAVSNRIFIGSIHIADVPVPDRLLEIASLFRAGGRFIWVPAYALVVFATAILLARVPLKIALPIVVVASVLQLWEIKHPVTGLHRVLSMPSEELIDESQMRGWMRRHQQIFQFTSWSCGGLWNGNDAERAQNGFRELQIMLMAARLGLPTNTAYTSRQIKDCAKEARWPLQPRLKPGVLYFINKISIDRAPALTALAHSPACVDIGWALACSREPLNQIPPVP